ncbi:MAG TPA: hypothetical protein VHT91_00835 [Kofleriaceae bacterium]|jgi:hypothetical protein|nr:hypothetical protein [Kofleriaceae bacterium]
MASDVYHGACDVGKAISGGVKWAQDGITSGVHSAEDWVNQESHTLASTVADVPVLGTLAEGMADNVSMTTEVLGGVVGGATSLVGGVVNAVAHPLDTAAGVEALAEHVPVTGDLLRMGHNALNVVEGKESVGEALDHSFNPLTIAQDDTKFWGAMGSAIIDPYKQSIDEGRYGEVAGRAAFDIGSLLIGAGEANAGVKGAEVAADAARATEIAADAARGSEIAADAARGSEVAADAARGSEVAADASRTSEIAADAERATDATRAAEEAVETPARDAPGTTTATDEVAPEQMRQMSGGTRTRRPLTAAEQESARAYAEELGMPGKDIVFDDRPTAQTSWGAMFDGEKEQLTIAEDLHAAPEMAGEELSANARVTDRGAIAHEIVGHREAYMNGRDLMPRDYEAWVNMSEEEQLMANAHEEAQASLRAAKFAPGLSDAERMTLFEDAMERLGKVGKGIDDVPDLGLNLEKRTLDEIDRRQPGTFASKAGG